MGWYIVFLILNMVIWVTVRSSCLQDINSASTPLVLGSLSNDDGNSNENSKKTIGLYKQSKSFNLFGLILFCDYSCMFNLTSSRSIKMPKKELNQYLTLLFLEPEWAIDSEAMRTRGIIVLVKSN